jgi:hypothetical protein
LAASPEIPHTTGEISSAKDFTRAVRGEFRSSDAGTTRAVAVDVMSISDRVTHVSSILLILAFAFVATGWTSTERTTHCMPQNHGCSSRVSVTCCCPLASTPFDRIQRLRPAPPPTYVSTASLMDDSLGSLSTGSSITSLLHRNPNRLTDGRSQQLLL